MPRCARKLFEGAKYHVTMRGNWRDAIFLHGADYQRFVDQLTDALNKDNIILYAYALMPNHYHLLVETPNANLPHFLQRLNTAYSLYYRHKHQRPGHAFQGRYGAKLVQGDQYILALTRYIHLNPVKVKSVVELDAHWKLEHLMSYEWTSYKGYVDPKRIEPMVDYRWLNLMGGKSEEDNRRLYRKYIEAMLLKCDQHLLDALHADEEVIGESVVSGCQQLTEYAQLLNPDTTGRDGVWTQQLKTPQADSIVDGLTPEGREALLNPVSGCQQLNGYIQLLNPDTYSQIPARSIPMPWMPWSQRRLA